MSMKDDFGPTQEQWRRIARLLMAIEDTARYSTSYAEIDETDPVFVRFDDHGVDFSVIDHDEADTLEAIEMAKAEQASLSVHSSLPLTFAK